MNYYFNPVSQELIAIDPETKAFSVLAPLNSTPPPRNDKHPKVTSVSNPKSEEPQKRRKTSDTQKEMIEKLLIEGKMKPGEIAEEAEVKPFVVYMFKQRLKNEGKLQ